MHFTLWPALHIPRGGYGEITWEFFREFVSNPPVQDEVVEGWSPAKFAENRRKKDRAELVSCVTLDDDVTGLPIERVAELWGWCAGIIHTTRRHTSAAPRYRIVLKASRDMTGAEYERVWRVVRDYAAKCGQTLDESTKDPSRYWFVPTKRPGGEYRWCELAGAPLDVDAILATAPATPELPRDRGPEPQRTELSPVVGGLGRRGPVAAMLGAAWPAKGRHEAQLALAGALRSDGFTEAEALDFLCDVCRAAGDEDRPKRAATIAHTYAQPDGAPLTGWTRLKSFVDPVFVDSVRKLIGRDAEWNELVERKLATAAQVAQAAQAPAAPPAPTGDTIKAGPFVFKVGGLDAPLPPLSWAIGDLICRGDVVMLVAHGNSLKTWLAFSLALSIATGRPWLGRFMSSRGRVAILDYESGEYEVARRLKLLGARDAELEGRLLRNSYSGAQLVDPETWIALAELGLELLVIDSFNAASPETDENDARAAVVLQRAGKFANATGCTVIVIHHARKGSGGDSREVVRGSTALYAACDRVFKFDEVEKKDGGVVSTTMRSLKDGAGRSPAPVSVELSDQGLRYLEPEAPKPEEDKPTPEKNRSLVLSVLKQNSRGVPKEHLVNLMAGKREKKFELLSQLVLSGLAVEYRDTAEKKVFVMLKPGSEP